MKLKIIIENKVKTFKVRDISLLNGVIKNCSSITKDKSKVIPRKQKYKNFY